MGVLTASSQSSLSIRPFITWREGREEWEGRRGIGEEGRGGEGWGVEGEEGRGGEGWGVEGGMEEREKEQVGGESEGREEERGRQKRKEREKGSGRREQSLQQYTAVQYRYCRVILYIKYIHRYAVEHLAILSSQCCQVSVF